MPWTSAAPSDRQSRSPRAPNLSTKLDDVPGVTLVAPRVPSAPVWPSPPVPRASATMAGEEAHLLLGALAAPLQAPQSLSHRMLSSPSHNRRRNRHRNKR